MTKHRKPVRVLMLAFDGINLLDIAGPLQAFAAAEPSRGAATRYDVTVASATGGAIPTAARMPIVTACLADLDIASFDTVLVGGGSDDGHPLVPPALVDWLSVNDARFRRIGSICAGAFILAATGALAERRATTHWHWAALLQLEHPVVRVEPDAIYVEDGRYWTSAGVTAGIDLTLALIEADYGHAVAIEAARRLVVFMRRPGGQSQFSTPLLLQARAGARFGDLHAWMLANLSSDLRVATLADRAGMTERTFNRAYLAAVRTTPAKAVEMMRLEAATGLLETTALPLKTVAAAVGLGDEQNLRRVFTRRLQVTPGEYRARFAGRN